MTDNTVLPCGAEPRDPGTREPGETWTRTFDEPGTYDYGCQLHELDGMLGSIILTAYANSLFRSRHTGRESCEAGGVGWMGAGGHSRGRQG